MKKKNKVFYRFCYLERKIENGYEQTWSWLPSKYAVKDEVLKLKTNGRWANGWVVKNASQAETDTPPDWRKMRKGHRNNTGDSLPKEDKNGK